MIQVTPQEIGFVLWLACAGIWYIKRDRISNYATCRESGHRHYRINVGRIGSLIIGIWIVLKKLLYVIFVLAISPFKFMRLVLVSPMKIVYFVRHFQRAWTASAEGMVAVKASGKKERWVKIRNGQNVLTDKQLSKLMKEGVDMAARAYPAVMVAGIVQLQSKQFNSISRIQGGRWVTHGGGVLVEARGNGRSNGRDTVDNFFESQHEYDDWRSDTEYDL